MLDLFLLLRVINFVPVSPIHRLCLISGLGFVIFYILCVNNQRPEVATDVFIYENEF